MNENPGNTINWNTDEPVDQWAGINVQNNRVVSIDLRQKKLTNLPDEIGNLTAVTTLLAFQNEINHISPQIGNMTALSILSIHTNQLNELPKELGNLNLITRFFFSDNNIQSLPAEFQYLNNINETWAQNNRLGYSDLEILDINNITTKIYSPQNNLSENVTIYYNNTHTITVPDSAINNQYQWYNSQGLINGETSRSITINSDDSYYCIITNSEFSSLASIQTGEFNMIDATDFLNDSTAIANIYKNNPDNNLNWNLNSPISTWQGVLHSGNPLDRVTELDISMSNISILPSDISNLDALNNLQLQNNNLIFEELEKITQPSPNNFIYSPQNKVGSSEVIPYSGNPITLSLPVEISSPNNTYQWFKDDVPVSSNGNSSSLTTSKLGTYYCEINNSVFTQLTLISEPQYILDPVVFANDSSAVAEIYSKNSQNSLEWNTSLPITTWNGVNFTNGRVNSLKIENAAIDTIPKSISILDELDTLWINNNNITFEMMEAITATPVNFIYQPQQKIGKEVSFDITGGKTASLEIPSTFDPNTANNNYQWYLNDISNPIQNANSRTYNTSVPGIYFCTISNNNFPLLTLQTNNYILFDQDQLQNDSTAVLQILYDNPQSTLNWQDDQPIHTWDGISINNFRVTAINIDNKNITNITNRIGELQFLDSLIISNNNIQELPNEIGANTNLIVFDAHNNNFNSLNPLVGNWNKIKYVNLMKNQIDSLPLQKEQWSAIDTLLIQENKLTFKDITIFPNSIDKYNYNPQDSIGEVRKYTITRPTTISIDYTIDSEVQNIEIQWYYNQNIINGATEDSIILDNPGIYNYTFKNDNYPELTLTSRNINVSRGNGTDPLDSLALIAILNNNPGNTINWNTDEPVDQWAGINVQNNRVVSIDLRQKKLTNLPDEIGNLTAVTTLLAFQNEINHISPQIGNMTALSILSIHTNQLNELPKELGNLNLITRFFFSDNNIQSLPAEFQYLNNINETWAQNNRLGYSDLEILDINNITTKIYSPQNNLSENVTIYYNNTHTITVPDSAVNNQYQWYNSQGLINGETNRNFNVTSEDIYYCIITNPDFPDLAQIQTGNYTLINASAFFADSIALLSLSSVNPKVNLNWDPSLQVANWDSISHSGFQGNPIFAVKLHNVGLITIPSDFTINGALLNLDTFDISKNQLTFYDLYNAQAIINQNAELINYSDQATVGEERAFAFTNNEITLTIDPTIQDTRNNYQWYKDKVRIEGANTSSYTTSEIGQYYCAVTNDDFRDLTLQSAFSYIYSESDFISDSTIVASIYTDPRNNGNLLDWDLTSPISEWSGVQLVGGAGRVQGLILEDKKLNALPDNIGELAQMETLDIGNNTITTLPASIENLQELKALKISNNGISTIIDGIYNLGNLEVLDIQGNNLHVLDEKVNGLVNLELVQMQNNHFTFDDIGRIPQTSQKEYNPQGIVGEEQRIATSGNITIQIDSTIDPDVTSNQYQWFYEGLLIPGANEREYFVSSEFGEYVCEINNPNYSDLTLTTASVFVVIGTTNPEDSLVLNSIKELNANHTLNWSIDDPVGLWEGVKVDGYTARVVELDIWNKNIDVLPVNFATLDALRSVNISANNLFELPDDIGDLEPSLTYFNASQNHLTFAELDKVRLRNSNQRINFVYGNQKLVGEADLTITLENGVNYLEVPKQDQTENDAYQWYYKGSPLEGETADSIRVNNIGEYNYTITNSHYKDIVLTSFPILVDGVTGIKNPIASKISVYPNPTDSDINVLTFEDIRILEVSVFDVTGKEFKVESRAKSLYKWTIDLQDIPSGMYLVRVNTDKGIAAIKVSKR
ncbi:leucine-rich repeat domain-containing protein [Flammeovirga aprica]|uniref:T9SS type A sorting domain-containing protein n=1 Tax=Flammeovirga aprica JL-4 TaxID=694437 RepID=A0A7X9RTZ8_9BACT|nr:T9SS type A sorting domain-containing protein [Flammeovirga aprica]NME68177.1 T9SS type A sorting domain-containing protein [Flammeovirga aprica JL-4]